MDRRQLLQVAAAGTVAALVLGADIAAGPVFHLDLPFVQSSGPFYETQLSGGKWYLGHYYSAIPRTTQLKDTVDAALASFKGQLITLRLTLLDAHNEPVGPSCTYHEAFLRETALGWFGASRTLKDAGLFTNEVKLDSIRSVRVEVLPMPHPLSGEIVRIRRLMDKERQKRAGTIFINPNGYVYAGGLSNADFDAFRDQVRMARQDPDYKILTSHRVTNRAKELKGRIISMPGASDRDLFEARETLGRGESVVWYEEVQFC